MGMHPTVKKSYSTKDAVDGIFQVIE